MRLYQGEESFKHTWGWDVKMLELTSSVQDFLASRLSAAANFIPEDDYATEHPSSYALLRLYQYQFR